VSRILGTCRPWRAGIEKSERQKCLHGVGMLGEGSTSETQPQNAPLQQLRTPASGWLTSKSSDVDFVLRSPARRPPDPCHGEFLVALRSGHGSRPPRTPGLAPRHEVPEWAKLPTSCWLRPRHKVVCLRQTKADTTVLEFRIRKGSCFPTQSWRPPALLTPGGGGNVWSCHKSYEARFSLACCSP
jgi:hypothetical protein